MPEPYGNFRERSEATIWNSLNQVLLIFIGLILFVAAIAILLPDLASRRTEQAQVDKIRENVDKQKLLLAKQTKELHLLQTNPEYLEIFARDRLDMMKEGETVFRVETEVKQ